MLLSQVYISSKYLYNDDLDLNESTKFEADENVVDWKFDNGEVKGTLKKAISWDVDETGKPLGPTSENIPPP